MDSIPNICLYIAGGCQLSMRLDLVQSFRRSLDRVPLESSIEPIRPEGVRIILFRGRDTVNLNAALFKPKATSAAP